MAKQRTYSSKQVRRIAETARQIGEWTVRDSTKLDELAQMLRSGNITREGYDAQRENILHHQLELHKQYQQLIR